MKDNKLPLKNKNHVIYSKKCKKLIKKYISEHYKKEEVEHVWDNVQLRYCDYLNRFSKDLGGKKNFHNGRGGTYDCFLILSYYSICKDIVTFKEIEKIEEELILPSFRKIRFVNANKRFFFKLLYKSCVLSKSKADKFNDYKMIIYPYEENKPIKYEFRSCPVMEFAKEFGLEEIMPALCNIDYKAMECIHAKLVRKGTLLDSNCCDYAICPDKDEYLNSHPEYIDEKGQIRNK